MSKESSLAWVDSAFRAVLAVLVLVWIAFPPQRPAGHTRLVSGGTATDASEQVTGSRP